MVQVYIYNQLDETQLDDKGKNAENTINQIHNIPKIK